MADKVLFISHASEDGPAVQRIVDYLEREGVSCWIAGRDIPPRSIYAEAITDAVKNAQACGVIVSRAANASAAIKRELELASRYERPFIPIRIDEVEPGPGLDYYLNNVQWMEYKREGDRALDRIVAHMRGQSYVAPRGSSKKARRWALMGLASAAVVGAVAVGLWQFINLSPTGDSLPSSPDKGREPAASASIDPAPADTSPVDPQAAAQPSQSARDVARQPVSLRRAAAALGVVGTWTYLGDPRLSAETFREYCSTAGINFQLSIDGDTLVWAGPEPERRVTRYTIISVVGNDIIFDDTTGRRDGIRMNGRDRLFVGGIDAASEAARC